MMFSSPSLPACLKRKSASSTPPTSNKRARLVGTFEPRLIIPTGARRSWTFAKSPRFILDPVTQGAKRTLVGEEEIAPSPSNCKVRLLDNRDALFLPGQKRLATKRPQRRRTSISSPSKKSLEFVRLRRRDQFKRQLQRVDSGICMESDEDLDLNAMLDTVSSLESGEDIIFFDASTFTGFSVEMMETTETATEDNMEIEDAFISTTTTATATAASSEGDADSNSTSTEQATSSSKGDAKEEGLGKDMPVEEKGEEEEDRDSGIDVEIEDAEKKTPEQREVSNQPSTKDTVVKDHIQKRLGINELIKLGPPSPKRGVVKKEEEADDEDDEPPRRSTRRKSVKPSLPTTVEEEEEEEEKEKGREGDDAVVIKRRSSRVKAKVEEEMGEEESEKETEKEEKKEEKKEKKKLIRRKVKAEEPESGASEGEREDEKKLQKKVKGEAKIEVEKELEEDKMEEDTDESLDRSAEDTDMSTDEDIVDFVPETEEKTQVEDPVIEDPAEEDVTMSEDDEMTEEAIGDISEEQLQKEAKEEIEAEKASKDTGEVKDIETIDAVDEENGGDNFHHVPTIEVKKTVRRLVLSPSKKDEFEISKMLSAPKTPRTPRSPNMSRFNIALSKAPRKLEPLLSPRRKKLNKFEDLSPHWTMKKLAAKKGQQPFNPANISRHAYRDPTNDEDLLTTRKCFWDDDDPEEPYTDDQYLRVEWPLKSWGSSWMAENGSALIEFCVRKLECFNMGW